MIASVLDRQKVESKIRTIILEYHRISGDKSGLLVQCVLLYKMQFQAQNRNTEQSSFFQASALQSSGSL